MPSPMYILVNDFAIRSFRETADKGLHSCKDGVPSPADSAVPVVCPALHCLEKYVKAAAKLLEFSTRKPPDGDFDCSDLDGSVEHRNGHASTGNLIAPI